MTQATQCIVSQGDYSDYSVLGVFSTRDLAEKYAEIVCGRVEDIPVDPELPYVPEGLLPWRVTLQPDGQSMAVRTPAAGFTESIYHEWGRTQCFIYARDKEHAVKIASDKDRILRATGQYVYVLIRDGIVVYSSLVESQPTRGTRAEIEASAEAHNALNQGVFSYKLHSIEPVES